jgi:aspartate/methionine/tyrosine aminotransferase
MRRLGTESAFEVLARARALEAEGRSIIHLEIGEPDFDTPEHIREAAKAALDAGHTHYVPAPGIMPLREAVAAFLERTGRLRTSPDRVIVTPGATVPTIPRTSAVAPRATVRHGAHTARQPR